MPLTLEETKALIAALGVRVPDQVLEQKARAEAFKAQREKIAADAAGKPAGWRFKQEFDEVLKRALESAGKQEFEPALKLLDDAGQLLQRPDAPPPVAKAGAAFNDKEFQKKWTAAKEVWRSSLETIDHQINEVRSRMLASKDPEFKIIADRGLTALTDNHKTPVMKALFELDGPPGDARKNAAAKANAAIAAFRSHIESFHLIASLDKHSQAAFGVRLTIRSEIGKGLGALDQAIQGLLD